MNSEFGFIDTIKERIDNRNLTLGIGDDCAVFKPQSGHEVLTTSDMLLEGIHFDLAWTDLYRLGRKSLSVSLSDVAAMGGRPLRAYLSVAFPKTWNDQMREEYVAGFLSCANEFGVTLAGGDTCASTSGFVISVTVEGEIPVGKSITRGGASSGDRLFVTGTLGDSALALSLLEQGLAVDETLLDRHFNPTPRVVVGEWLQSQGIVTSMIDISDGLLADLRHILDASSCGAELFINSLPFSRSFLEATADKQTTYKLALSGGEDYELLFTVPAASVAQLLKDMPKGVNISEVGRITDMSGSLICVDSKGHPLTFTSEGFDHFAGRAE